jgi:hypothetical protein
MAASYASALVARVSIQAGAGAFLSSVAVSPTELLRVPDLGSGALDLLRGLEVLERLVALAELGQSSA